MLFEDAGEDRLHRLEDVFLLDEAHFHVELVEFARQAVGARVLVAEAGRDLEVAVEAGDHQQLLILLGGLRQRVELAGMDARGHEEIARAFGRGRRQDRRRELVEARVVHMAAHRFCNLEALHDDAVQRLAAQIQEAVLQAQIFRIIRLAENRDGQFLGFREHLDFGRIDLDLAGRQIRVVGTVGPPADVAVDPHDPFGAELLGHLEGGRIGIGHDLGQAMVVAQVDEQDAAMVADAVHPARKARDTADIGAAQAAAGGGAITVQAGRGHGLKSLVELGGKSGRRSARGMVNVKPQAAGGAPAGPGALR